MSNFIDESLWLVKNKQKITAKSVKNKYAEISAKANKVLARFSALQAARV